MSKIIARIHKIKTVGALAACLGHLTRERTTLNSDPELRKLNEIGVSQTIRDGVGHWRELTAKVSRKISKGQVLALEYFFSCSPGADLLKDPTQVNAFLADCVDYVEQRHGKARVIITAAHHDETTAHIHIVAVPLVVTFFQSKAKGCESKQPVEKLALTAKPFTGSRDLMRQFQDEAGKIGAKYGLRRGIRGSRAHHLDVQLHYGSYPDPQLPELQLPLFLPGESASEYRAKAKESVESQIRGPFQVLQATLRNLHLAFQEMVRMHKLEKDRADREKARGDASVKSLKVLLKELFSRKGAELVKFVEDLKTRVQGDDDGDLEK